jgi:hypothetical protein
MEVLNFDVDGRYLKPSEMVEWHLIGHFMAKGLGWMWTVQQYGKPLWMAAWVV